MRLFRSAGRKVAPHLAGFVLIELAVEPTIVGRYRGSGNDPTA
jgi:hypothetical protein